MIHSAGLLPFFPGIMRKRLYNSVALSLFGALSWCWLIWAQPVSITVTPVNNSFSVTAVDIAVGVKSSARTFDVSVTTTSNFSVSVELDNILVEGLPSSIPAAAYSLTATASGAVGTSDVIVDPFPSFGTNQDITGAFSGLAGVTNETSQLDVKVNLDQLGNRSQGETLDFNITLIITEQP